MASRFASKYKSNSPLNIPKVALWITLPLFSCLFLLTYVWNANSIKIYTPSSSFAYNVYGDRELGGHSSGTFTKEGESLTFKYELAEGYAYPYTGLYFTIPAKTLENVSAPSCFYLNLKASQGLEIPIILNEKTTINGTPNHRLWQYNLKLAPSTTNYKVLLSDFEVPAWWYKQYPLYIKNQPLDLAKVDGMCIQNCTHLGLGKQDQLKIQSVTFQKDLTNWYIGLAAGLMTLLCIGILYIIFNKRRKTVLIPFVATATEVSGFDDWQRIQSYLSMHYMEELSMETLQQDLGIAKHKIATLVKENTSLIFKQYLNQIRIAEATRLLTETDIPIGEIADKVGYGHISNFNRVFKEYTQQSPSHLRKDAQSLD